MARLTNLSFEFFYEIFTEVASPLVLYDGAKKSKMTKNSNQGSYLNKKVKFDGVRCPFRHFCVSKVITTAHAHRTGVIFIFFQELSKKN